MDLWMHSKVKIYSPGQRVGRLKNEWLPWVWKDFQLLLVYMNMEEVIPGKLHYVINSWRLGHASLTTSTPQVGGILTLDSQTEIIIFHGAGD
jgi:hypothetical protein